MATRQIKMPVKENSEQEVEGSVLATQAARAWPIFAPSRPANEGLLRDLRNRPGGGFGHQKELSDRAGVGLRQRR
jgi:hypothetical protein